jgi:quinol monooxygenase YgiN
MSQSDEVHVFANLSAKPGKEAELRAVLTELVSHTRQEPGCVQYMLHVDPKVPQNFYVFEIYKDEAGVAAHMGSPHLAAAFAKAGDLVTGAPVIVSTKLVAGG